MQGYLGFIAFNATVVFATGFSRWLGIAGCVVLTAMAIRSWKASLTGRPR